MKKPNTKEYKFKQGFSIKPRLSPCGIFYAMGETQIFETQVFDLYEGKQFIDTYETFDEAKIDGIEFFSGN